jgi:hypothetical protein
VTQDAYDLHYVCEVLSKQHDRKRFDCGVSVLNDYLARIASQDVKRKAAAVFVMSPANDKQRIAGFYTLCSTSVELSGLPPVLAKRLPRYPEVPGFLIGRLARDVAFPGVGSLLVADALLRCVRIADEVAATLVVVDAKDESARGFYAKQGFLELPNITNRMFLPISTAEKLFRETP